MSECTSLRLISTVCAGLLGALCKHGDASDPHKTSLAEFPSNKAKISRTPEKARGIPQRVETELFTDIEAFGGIDSASLAFICDRKPGVYGESGSSLRKQIQNKVAYWKRYDCKQYRALLLRIKPQEEQQDGLDTSQDSISTPPSETTPSQRVYSSPPLFRSTSKDKLILESLRTPMLSTSVAAPSRVSQSASKNATYIEHSLQTENYGERSIPYTDCWTAGLLT